MTKNKTLNKENNSNIDQKKEINEDVSDSETSSDDDRKIVAHLKVLKQDGQPERIFPIYEGITTIGRNDSNDICLNYLGISSYHSRIEVVCNEHFIEDLNSTNYTHFGDVPIRPTPKMYQLLDKRKISFGRTKCIYEIVQVKEEEANKTLVEEKEINDTSDETEIEDEAQDLIEPNKGDITENLINIKKNRHNIKKEKNERIEKVDIEIDNNNNNNNKLSENNEQISISEINDCQILENKVNIYNENQNSSNNSIINNQSDNTMDIDTNIIKKIDEDKESNNNKIDKFSNEIITNDNNDIIVDNDTDIVNVNIDDNHNNKQFINSKNEGIVSNDNNNNNNNCNGENNVVDKIGDINGKENREIIDEDQEVNIKIIDKRQIQNEININNKEEMETDMETDVKSDTVIDVETDVKTDMEIDVETDLKTDVETDIETDAETGIETNIETNNKYVKETTIIKNDIENNKEKFNNENDIKNIKETTIIENDIENNKKAFNNGNDIKNIEETTIIENDIENSKETFNNGNDIKNIEKTTIKKNDIENNKETFNNENDIKNIEKATIKKNDIENNKEAFNNENDIKNNKEVFDNDNDMGNSKEAFENENDMKKNKKTFDNKNISDKKENGSGLNIEEKKEKVYKNEENSKKGKNIFILENDVEISKDKEIFESNNINNKEIKNNEFSNDIIGMKKENINVDDSQNSIGTKLENKFKTEEKPKIIKKSKKEDKSKTEVKFKTEVKYTTKEKSEIEEKSKAEEKSKKEEYKTEEKSKIKEKSKVSEIEIMIEKTNKKKRKNDNIIEHEKESKPKKSRKMIDEEIEGSVDAPRIIFTGIDDQYFDIVRDLGGIIEDSWENCTHLVTDKIRRTVKFLCVLATGKKIVSLNWVKESKKAGKFLDPNKYILKDPASEKKWKFTMKTSLKHAHDNRKEPIFTGLTFYMTPNTKPPYDEMETIINAAGGTLIKNLPEEIDNEIIILSCPDDNSFCKSLINRGYDNIHSNEFILSGILKQKVDFKCYKIKVETNSKNNATAGGRKRKR